MTPANVKKCAKLAKHFRTLAIENPDAHSSMWAMHHVSIKKV